MMDVFDVVSKEFVFPFPPYDYQRRALNKTVLMPNLLLPLKVGRGKTAMATWRLFFDVLAHGVNQGMIIVPAGLVTQWHRWMSSIKLMDGSPVEALAYQGTPVARAKMDLLNADIIIMSRQIFVQDYARIRKEMGSLSNVHVVYDESQDGLRNVGNRVWRNFHQFTFNKRITLLSGTPVDKPVDNYAVIKLLDPKIYPTKRKFEQDHVLEIDYWGKVIEWKNLDVLRDNLYKNAVEIPDSELGELPALVIQEVPYILQPKHRKLYDEFVDEQLLTNDNGEVLDGTETNRMFHALQQFVTGPDRMDFKKVQAALHDLLWSIYTEDDSKLIVYAYYKNTNRSILDYFTGKKVRSVGYWGEQNTKEQQASFDEFVDDENCRVLVGNWGSMGVGTDGLQHVCHRAVFAEQPLTPTRFIQACGRIDRTGQVNKCIVKCLIAQDTIQSALFKSFMNKDDILGQITRQHTSIRSIIQK
jgi:ERCC4-related helicase